MDSHRAKRSALQKYCNELRQAINADVDSLSFKLRGEGLIPQEVRDSKAADKIVASVEYRLSFDESAWDKLIKVLYECGGSAVLADKLIKHFTAEMSGQDAHRDNASERQRPNGSGATTMQIGVLNTGCSLATPNPMKNRVGSLVCETILDAGE